jgi:DtxR family Mn-dependent transcriptional regulator
MALTSHVEEYLEAIYRLGGQDTPVPLATLATRLDISVVSANEMVRRLQEQGLLTYTPYHGVLLQEEGLCEALAILRRHRLWERFLTDKLGFSWDVVHEEACRLEHAASDKVTERLAEWLGDPERCPHGHPVPQPGCVLEPESDAVCLSELEAGHDGTVAYVASEEAELLRYLESLGIRPDATIAVAHVAPFDGPLTVYVNDCQQTVGRGVARSVFVDRSSQRS